VGKGEREREREREIERERSRGEGYIYIYIYIERERERERHNKTHKIHIILWHEEHLLYTYFVEVHTLVTHNWTSTATLRLCAQVNNFSLKV